MKKALAVYAYLAPVMLAPASFYLWYRTYAGNVQLVITAWLIPIVWAYVVPGIGTNVLKVWEFDARFRLGRFRVHHGFVFGSATALLAWIVHAGPATDLWAAGRGAIVMASVLGFVNLLYDVKAVQAGVLRVYNQPWAEGKPEAEVVMDYAPWFFGGFGAVYGAGIGTMEWLDARVWLSMPVFVTAFTAVLILSALVPTLGYIRQSIRRHGHWGTRPVAKRCQNA